MSDQTSFGLLPQECLATHDGRAAGGQNTFWTTLPHMQQTATTPELASVSEVGTLSIKTTQTMSIISKKIQLLSILLVLHSLAILFP